MKSLRVSFLRETIDLRAARIAESEDLCDLVKGFPGGVVQRAAKQAVAPVAFHIEEKGVPAANDQGHMCGDDAFTEERREQVTLEVIYREERAAGAKRETFGRGSANEQGCCEPGSGCRRKSIDL